MRVFRLIVVLATVLAVAAIGVTTASASILPGVKGTKITGKSGKATLQVKEGTKGEKPGPSITCEKSTTASGEVLSTTEALAVITFENCTTLGLATNSLGDPVKTILAHVEVTDCPDTPTGRALEFKLLPLHLEVPSTKLLLLVEGSVLGLITPVGKKATTFTLTIEQKEGKQAVEKCEGGTAKTLTTSIDGSAAIQSGQEAKEGTLTFAAEEEFMA